MSVSKLRKMGIPMFLPYKFQHERMKTSLGGFGIESFRVPHNGCTNNGFLIRAENQTIAFMVDLEYNPWDMSNIPINVLLVECNYISDLATDDLPNLVHKTLGHCELETTIGIIKNCQKHLRKVFLIHASKGKTMNKERALKRIREEIPSYIKCEFVKENTEYDISECPF